MAWELDGSSSLHLEVAHAVSLGSVSVADVGRSKIGCTLRSCSSLIIHTLHGHSSPLHTAVEDEVGLLYSWWLNAAGSVSDG